MNKEQQELLNGAYENYLKGGNIKWLKQIKVETPSGAILATIPYDKEEFITKCKTDSEFTEKWGLKIEERELRQDERYNLLTRQMTKLRAIRKEDYINYNIPTKLITITYNNETIESYE